MQDNAPAETAALPVRTKLVYATGDHTVNLSLSALSLLYLFFLTEYAGLQPYLAGLIMWVPRIIDAFTDPLMGRISDRTPWRWGRRRPYFLIGALPFGITFALLWLTPFESQSAKFAYHISVYIALSLCTTVLSVPYLALLPEMARGYDERTSLNTYRAAAAVLGTFAAVGMQGLAEALGGSAGYAQVGAVAGITIFQYRSEVAVLAYQFGDGFTNILVPTNAVLVGILAMAAIPYDRWVRFVFPFMVKMWVLGSLALAVAVAIGYA